jgi:hypothetical protein
MWAGYWGSANPWLRYRGYSAWPGYGYGPYGWGAGRFWQIGGLQPSVAPWYNPPEPAYGFGTGQELDLLKSQASILQQQMDQIQKRIDEIEKEEKPKKT